VAGQAVLHRRASVARELGVQGLSTTVVTACSASTAAMALAADLIRCGMLDAALAGGADAFSTSTLAGFEGLKATSEGKCAPFSKPFGLNLGEAAAFVFLESLTSARKRQVAIQAEILGSGMSNDAFHCSGPNGGRGLATPCNARSPTPDFRRNKSLTSMLTAQALRPTTRPRPKPFAKCSARRRNARPSVPPKAWSATVWGGRGGGSHRRHRVREVGVLPPTANFTGPREGCALDCVPEAGRAWLAPQVFSEATTRPSAGITRVRCSRCRFLPLLPKRRRGAGRGSRWQCQVATNPKPHMPLGASSRRLLR